MNELKPCPFCGNKPVVLENQFYVHEEKFVHYQVLCVCGGRLAFRDTAEEAIEAWNRRVSE